MPRSRKVGGRRLKNTGSPAELREKAFQALSKGRKLVEYAHGLLSLAREREAAQIEAERAYHMALDRQGRDILEKGTPDEKTAFMLGHLGRQNDTK